MLIKLNSSTIPKNAVWSDELLIVLENLAIAKYEKKHLLFIDRDTLNRICNNTRFHDLSFRSRNIYKEMEVDNVELGRVLRNISEYIDIDDSHYATPKIIKEKEKTIIKVSLSFFENSQTIQETILLCENQNDAKFYLKVAQVYRLSEKIQSFRLNFEPRGGGGSTIIQEYEAIQSDKKRFCLSIVDSDKVSPESSYGGTAKDLKKLNDPDAVSTKLVILECREIENLIPISLLYELFNKDKNREKAYKMLKNISQRTSIQSIIPYLDIKEGTRLKSILIEEDDEVKKFWESKVKELFQIYQKCHNKCLENWQCVTPAKCQCFLTPSFSQNLLNDTLEWMKNNSDHKILEKIKNDDLVFLEWQRIGKILVDWGISGYGNISRA